MSEDRLQRVELMLTDLIRIVGNTNAMVEEMREKLDGQGKDLDSLRKDVEQIKATMATKEDIKMIHERLDLHRNKLALQEEDIHHLKVAVGIR